MSSLSLANGMALEILAVTRAKVLPGERPQPTPPAKHVPGRSRDRSPAVGHPGSPRIPPDPLRFDDPGIGALPAPYGGRFRCVQSVQCLSSASSLDGPPLPSGTGRRLGRSVWYPRNPVKKRPTPDYKDFSPRRPVDGAETIAITLNVRATPGRRRGPGAGLPPPGGYPSPMPAISS